MYLGLPRCQNPVLVLMILAPPVGEHSNLLSSSSPVVFLTNDTQARDFHLYEGNGFSTSQLDESYLGNFFPLVDDVPFVHRGGPIQGIAAIGSSSSGSLPVSPDADLSYQVNGATGWTDDPQTRLRGIYGFVLNGSGNDSYFAVSYLSNLVMKRSLGSCYVQVPTAWGMGLFEGASLSPLVSSLGSTFGQTTIATYQLLSAPFEPSQAFGLGSSIPPTAHPRSPRRAASPRGTAIRRLPVQRRLRGDHESRRFSSPQQL